MKLRENRRQPFFGEATDRELLGPDFKPTIEGFEEPEALPSDLAQLQTLDVATFKVVDEYSTLPLGTEVDVEGERGHVSAVDRERGVVTISAGPAPKKAPHPDCREKGTEIALGFVTHQGANRRARLADVATFEPAKEAKITRRELLRQRRRKERGQLDPVLRRLQRERLKK